MAYVITWSSLQNLPYKGPSIRLQTVMEQLYWASTGNIRKSKEFLKCKWMQNRHVCEINISLELVFFFLFTPPPKNKTHINKVQHLTNKLSQSSFAVLGKFYTRKVWKSIHSPQCLTHACAGAHTDTDTHTHTHTHTRPRTTTHTTKRKLNVSPAYVSFQWWQQQGQRQLTHLGQAPRSDGCVHWDWSGCHWLTLKFVKTSSSTQDQVNWIFVSFPEGFPTWKSILLKSATGSKSWFSFKFVCWKKPIVKCKKIHPYWFLHILPKKMNLSDARERSQINIQQWRVKITTYS